MSPAFHHDDFGHENWNGMSLMNQLKKNSKHYEILGPTHFQNAMLLFTKGDHCPKGFYFKTTFRTILMIFFHLMPFLSHWVNTIWNRTANHIIWNRVHKWELLRWLFVFKKWLDGQRLNWHFIIHYLRVGAPFADQNLWWITLICENGKGNCCRKNSKANILKFN